jgi:hypothetical protein
MNKLGLSHLRFKKLKELIKVKFNISFLCRNGEIVYGRNLIDFMLHGRRTNILEFCAVLRVTNKLPKDSAIEYVIDTAYSNFILSEYDIKDQGADFKFYTIRNVFKDAFKSKEYMVNHYSHKLSLPVIKLLQKEFKDKDVFNIIPAKPSIVTVLRGFEDSIYDYVRREYNLVRAGPYHHLSLVA